MDSIAEATVRKDISESNAGDGILCELEVTVCTGFEMTAKEEIEETVSPACSVKTARGRVNMLVPIDYAKNVSYVCSLRYLRFPRLVLSPKKKTRHGR